MVDFLVPCSEPLLRSEMCRTDALCSYKTPNHAGRSHTVTYPPPPIRDFKLHFQTGGVDDRRSLCTWGRRLSTSSTVHPDIAESLNTSIQRNLLRFLPTQASSFDLPCCIFTLSWFVMPKKLDTLDAAWQRLGCLVNSSHVTTHVQLFFRTWRLQCKAVVLLATWSHFTVLYARCSHITRSCGWDRIRSIVGIFWQLNGSECQYDDDLTFKRSRTWHVYALNDTVKFWDPPPGPPANVLNQVRNPGF